MCLFVAFGIGANLKPSEMGWLGWWVSKDQVRFFGHQRCCLFLSLSTSSFGVSLYYWVEEHHLPTRLSGWVGNNVDGDPS